MFAKMLLFQFVVYCDTITIYRYACGCICIAKCGWMVVKIYSNDAVDWHVWKERCKCDVPKYKQQQQSVPLCTANS